MSYGQTPRQNSGWDTTSQDYHAYLSMPNTIPDALRYPNVHRVFNNKYTYEKEAEFQEEHHRKRHSASPKSQKKVQVVEQVETIEETRDEKCKVNDKETTVDVQADGYIQQKHKGFELCKWKTFKVP